MNIFGEEVIRIDLYVHSRQTVLQYVPGTAHSLNLINFCWLLDIYSRIYTLCQQHLHCITNYLNAFGMLQ